LDADGDLDMIVGGGIGFMSEVDVYENIGTPEEPDFILQQDNLIGTLYNLAFPELVDIDNDGDLDLFVGDAPYGPDNDRIRYYENVGDSSRYNFQLVNINYIEGYHYQPMPRFYDVNNDGDYDLLFGEGDRMVYYENIGTPETPNLICVQDTFENLLFSPAECHPTICDIDADLKADLFVGLFYGGIKYYHNITTGVAGKPFDLSPAIFALEPSYPNPFNPTTTISFTLNKALPVTLSVYNQLGQQVSTIIDNQVIPGSYQFTWDAGQFSSGVYLISLESSQEKQTQKVILLK